jgi:hypothetical protein
MVDQSKRYSASRRKRRRNRRSRPAKMGAVPKSNQPKCHVDIELLGFLPLTAAAAVINFDDLYSYYSD